MPKYFYIIMAYPLLSRPLFNWIRSVQSCGHKSLIPIIALFLGACTPQKKPWPWVSKALRIDTTEQKQASVLDLVVVRHPSAQETFQNLSSETYFKTVDTLRLTLPIHLWRFECAPGQHSVWMAFLPRQPKHYGAWIFWDRGSLPPIKQTLSLSSPHLSLKMKEGEPCVLFLSKPQRPKNRPISVYPLERTTHTLQRRF